MSPRSFAELAPYLDTAQRVYGGPRRDQAVSELLTQLRAVAMQYLRRHMSAPRAEDCVQEIVIAVNANLLAIDVATCGSYFRAATISRLYDARRHARRPGSSLSDRWVPLRAVPDLAVASNSSERLDAEELDAALRRACARLAPLFQEVALSVIADGERVRDFARRVGRSSALVRSQLRRARNRLQRDPTLRPWFS